MKPMTTIHSRLNMVALTTMVIVSASIGAGAAIGIGAIGGTDPATTFVVEVPWSGRLHGHFQGCLDTDGVIRQCPDVEVEVVAE